MRSSQRDLPGLVAPYSSFADRSAHSVFRGEQRLLRLPFTKPQFTVLRRIARLVRSVPGEPFRAGSAHIMTLWPIRVTGIREELAPAHLDTNHASAKRRYG
jgi:hypothetical protein